MVAELQTIFHNVSGTVTITDADTFRVDQFTYDGGGPAVYFYLGTDDTNAAYTNGLEITPAISGTVYDGTQGPLWFDLPPGQTFDNYQAISVWCKSFGVNFGSGVFRLPGDFNDDGFVGIEDMGIVLGKWNQTVTPGDLLEGDASGDGYVGIEDLNAVLSNWNKGVPPSSGEAAQNIPEPGHILLVMMALSGLHLRQRGI